jgi:hypothetical protein
MWAHISAILFSGEVFDPPLCILPFLALRQTVGKSKYYFSSGMAATVLPVIMIIAATNYPVNASGRSALCSARHVVPHSISAEGAKGRISGLCKHKSGPLPPAKYQRAD